MQLKSHNFYWTDKGDLFQTYAEHSTDTGGFFGMLWCDANLGGRVVIVDASGVHAACAGVPEFVIDYDIGPTHPGCIRRPVAGGKDGAQATKMEIRVTRLAVGPRNAPLFSDSMTLVELRDEGAGEYVALVPVTSEDAIKFDPEEWPAVRTAVERMLADCRE